MKRWIPFMKSHPQVAVVRLSGVISSSGRGSLNDAGIGPVLERAFTRGKPDAVALVINSPGGSPVQSALIGARIRRLADEKGIRVYAFVEDVAASGGYWLASSADEIYADASSIVGSIGVISSGFGLSEFIERHGIERRVYTAGKSKSTNDPFKPEKPADVRRLKGLLDQIHDVFKAQVTERRGDKLAADTDIFTGEYWIGAQAIELGLIDGLGHLSSKMKELYGEKVSLIRYDQRRPFWRRFGINIVDDVVSNIEERAEYARFGL
ncbi:S49 family peptidase [Halocynthiibacter sp. C4]|uniref:S49 family peptidase n=1 Tax=Halocynthiibacter sp. C4 TaxID=2992758 RepID=UPI00237AFA80|nr:S49 family peptidase [Halocynthiibacter sp. C4]MDE0590849.1 S49 family peptidase [Halocynthiibacter sp. C4]